MTYSYISKTNVQFQKSIQTGLRFIITCGGTFGPSASDYSHIDQQLSVNTAGFEDNVVQSSAASGYGATE